MRLSDFFLDPLLRGPTWGSMWMCFSASLLGVVIFLRKRSLIGEALSHAAYPGVTLAVMVSSFFQNEEGMQLLILGGAFASALFGHWVLSFLQEKLKISSDASLCIVLTVFFGMGVALASHVQFSHSQAYRQIQAYLYGQAATMSDMHTLLYGSFSLFVVLFLLLFYKQLQAVAFDKPFSLSIGLSVNAVERIFLVFVVLAVVMGIKSVGVVLMSAMLVAPAAAARQFTNRLPMLFLLSAVVGVASGFLGNYFSVFFSEVLASRFPEGRASLPTGPMIVLSASFFAVFSLLFAPQRGLVGRFIRVVLFRLKRKQENILKALWRLAPQEGKGEIAISDFLATQDISRVFLWVLFFRFRLKGWLETPRKGTCTLTKKGKILGGRIVRLHRLWEVYLVNYLGEGVERVHHSAEEMEHILTPEIEKELTLLLENPLHDPHAQPIPLQEEVMTHG